VNGSTPPDFGHDANHLAQAVSMGNLIPNAVAIAGKAALTSAIDSQRLTIREKDEKAREFILQIVRVNSYLLSIGKLIKDLEAEIAALSERFMEINRLAQEAYERSFEADDLIKAINDGISPEEHARLIALLGPEAANASIEELLPMLEAQEKTDIAAGDDFTAEAEWIEVKIDKRRSKLSKVEDLRDEYEHALPERRTQIEDTLDEMAGAEPSHQAIESAVTATPDFNVVLP